MATLSVTLVAAVLAGTSGAIVSQPGDTLLSVINQRSKEMLQARGSGISDSDEVESELVGFRAWPRPPPHNQKNSAQLP